MTQDEVELLRDEIGHSEVEQLTPELLKMVPRVEAYAGDLARRLRG